MQFKSIIKKGNNKGAGFVILPKDKKVNKGDTLLVKISENDVDFYANVRIYYKNLGFYIPSKVTINHNLLGKSCVFSVGKIKGFHTKVGSDGRLYLPSEVASKMIIQDEDCVLIEGKINKSTIKRYCKAKIRRKKKTTEFRCQFDAGSRNKKGVFRIIRVLKPLHTEMLGKRIHSYKINKTHKILFCGNMVPVVIKDDLDIELIAHHLGCYFADGTKRGNSWGMCASTFEQARYFMRTHKDIIPGCNLRKSLTITMNNGEEGKILSILKHWEKEAQVNIEKDDVRIHLTESKKPTNRNSFGTLVLKEHRKLVQIYYNDLIVKLLQLIKEYKRTDLAQQFICGVIEGDGCLNAMGRDHIQITSNDHEIRVIEKFLKYSNLDFKAHKEKSTGKVYVNIGGLSIKENLNEIDSLLFKYYPKRRRIMKQRMLNTPTTQFLLGKQSKTSAWILKRFRKKGILNEQNKLTAKGKKVRKSLQDLEKEIIPSPLPTLRQNIF